MLRSAPALLAVALLLAIPAVFLLVWSLLLLSPAFAISLFVLGVRLVSDGLRADPARDAY